MSAENDWIEFSRGFGGAACIGAIVTALYGAELQAQVMAILGPGMYAASYLAELTIHTKAYFDERLDVLKNQCGSDDLSKKVE